MKQNINRCSKLLIYMVAISIKLSAQILPGDAQFKEYASLIEGKRLGLVVNQTSVVNNDHLVNYLKSKSQNIALIFAPEHGFRGLASAGTHIADSIDEVSHARIISLYGKNFKPSPANMSQVDLMIFDIQDVGARFYTYISTLHYVMEACAESNKVLLILDRPNPNGYYIDGPILDTNYKSFVGMHPVPIVHGMTIGEYARMINGQGWLKGGIKCSLAIVPCVGYSHDSLYKLPIAPSPNLPNMDAIYLYPSLCLFEGTPVSVGRGTASPFQIIGSPEFKKGKFSFTPQSIAGKAENPPFLGKKCYGFNLDKFAESYLIPSHQLYLHWLIGFYQSSTNKPKFFSAFFDRLAGTDQLRNQIQSGESAEEIHQSWANGLIEFSQVRKKYLLYPDFPPFDYLSPAPRPHK